MTIRRPKTLLIFSFFLVVMWQLSRCGSNSESPQFITHEILAEKETCVQCHQNTTGFSPFHASGLIGCTPCHLGNANESNKDKAHKNMVIIAGNINDMDRTCGATNCHHDIPRRLESSLMTTMAGVVNVNRFVFGESDTLSKFSHIREISKNTPADKHLRQLCASCHLGNEKTESGPIKELSRGGGCNACHLKYSEEAIFSADKYNNDPESIINEFTHPSLTVKVTNDHCFGCHSRSGRISTSYEGWHETTIPEEEIPDTKDHRLLEDGRVFKLISPDVHAEAGLQCIDCHTSQGVMGDGNKYLHQEEAVYINCKDCHQTNAKNIISYQQLDPESKKLKGLRNLNNYSDNYIVSFGKESPLYNVTINDNDSIFVYGKNSGIKHYSPPPISACTKDNAHQALSCQSCHSPWAPQCIGCHNTYDPELTAIDLLDHKKVKGRWIEHIGEFFADPPVLGVVEKEINGDSIREIKTFISGMILTIDPTNFQGRKNDTIIRQRLFAPIDAHTTSANSRNCSSCHLDPHTLGYGRGSLELKKESPYWEFIPDYYEDNYDRLPQDAWIEFLQDPRGLKSTRPNARPFTLIEQKRVLRVGACLTCHEADSKVMIQGLENFQKILTLATDACIVPFY